MIISIVTFWQPLGELLNIPWYHNSIQKKPFRLRCLLGIMLECCSANCRNIPKVTL
jgi:hypothetical protein